MKWQAGGGFTYHIACTVNAECCKNRV